MFYYPPPPPPPPANIFHLAPGPYCSIPGPVGISGLFTFNRNPAPLAPTEEKAAKEKPKAPKKKILIPPLPPLLPPPPPPTPLPAAEGKKEEKKDEESVSVAQEGSKAKEKGKPKEEKEEEKKKEKKEKKKKVINTYLPPQIPKGTNFWFAAEFTQLHIFNKGVRIWEEKWRGDRKAFKAFTVDIHWPVRSIIERTRNHNTADETTTTEQQAAAVCSGWAVTEVIEAGDNTFLKGTTVAYGSEKAKVSLASMGWNGKRGTSLPPVWLTVQKV
ncbi:hypothetical protein KC318_g10514 [Hortaea werneckii]|nr:hypothetical protein KC334_g10697 [Hortaea werneckii]KAI6985326.1 hypothetical protein KC355_g10667 [Hortaea werneckii]KAI7178392.1 hypothetical protein KC324_g9492 [Hortaea werneckii]KAI7579940.1 hypothetical protein KC316_g9225 [Hortaea werneckii]KAI7659729.1 hypothetical protein KC318_g10514 [Hortaea werneckii]